MDMYNVGIREMDRRSDQHLHGQGRGITMDDEGFRTLSRVNDQGLSIREAAASSRFEWNHLLNGSRRISEFDGVERGGRHSREVVSGRNYDGLVERPLPIEVERGRNVPDYGPNVRVSEHGGNARNVSSYAPDVRVSEHRERNLSSYGPDVRASEHHERARNVSGLPVLDSGDLRVRVREYPPQMERETMRQPYDEGIERNGVRFRSDDGSRSLTPRSHSSGRHTPIEGIPRGSLEGLHHDVHHRNTDGFVRGGSIPSVRHNSFTPRSHYSDQETQFDAIPAESLEGLHQEVYPHRGAGFESSGSIPSSRGVNYHRGPYSSARGTTPPFPAEAVHFSRVEYSPDEGRSASYMHQDSQRSQNVYQRELSRDGHEDIHDTQEYRDHGVAFGINAEDPSLSSHYTGNRNVIPRSLVRDGYENNHDTLKYYDLEDANGNNVEDPALHRHRYTGYSDGSGLRENERHPALQPIEEALGLENYDHGRAVYETGREYGGEMLNTNVGQASDDNYETLHYQEHYGYTTDPHGMLCEGRNLNIPTLDEETLILDERGQQYGDLLAPERPKKMLKRKHGFGKDAGLPFRSISCLDKPHGRANVGTSETEDGQSFGGLSVDLQRRLSKPHESGRGDVKKRLKHPLSDTSSHVPHLPWWKKNAEDRVKPSPNAIHTTSGIQKLGKAKGINSNKKKPKQAPKSVLCPSAAPDSQVLHSGHNTKKPQKSTGKELEIAKEAPCSQTAEPNHSILKVKPVDKDPPEDSEEFRRQLDMWFLKFMEHLNSNIGRQRKFKEQTKGGAFKCIVCSSSTEFPDTKGVAMHAFSSPKVGYRAPHLGFHKALCVLMGWDNGAVAQNGRWTCQSLPEIEVWTLKEDIIIWPPVFIIHDSSARNYSHNEQAKVPEEQLQNVLKGMGLSDGNTKVCRGKPGNPGIMVVKFSGTLSGLKEAERLHNLFAEKKHGRAELQQLDAGGHCCEGVDQKSKDKIHDQLYGYLGIIEDLDKLNYDMKRHYRARSRRQILASVDAAP